MKNLISTISVFLIFVFLLPMVAATGNIGVAILMGMITFIILGMSLIYLLVVLLIFIIKKELVDPKWLFILALILSLAILLLFGFNRLF